MTTPNGDQVSQDVEQILADTEQVQATEVTSAITRDASSLVKSLETDDADVIKVGGYGIIFNKRDASPWHDYFVKSHTNFMWDEFPRDMRRPVLYEHGFDGFIKQAGVGVVTKIEEDDVGIWVEAQLNRRNKYTKMMLPLLDKGALGWSSGTVRHLAQRSRTTKGLVDQWPIIEFSFTPVPAMPEGTEVDYVKTFDMDPLTIELAYKSMHLEVPATVAKLAAESFVSEDTQESVETVESAPVVKSAAPIVSVSQPIKPSQEDETMELDVKALATAIGDSLKPAFEQLSDTIKSNAIKPGDTKSLPNPAGSVTVVANPLAGSDVKTAPRITVGDDHMFVDLTSSDLAFATEAFSAVAAGARFRQSISRRGASDLTSLQLTSLRFMDRYDDTENRSFERLISAKALREVSRKTLPEEIVEMLPYKSMDDVWANRYDGSVVEAAVKANELDHTAQASYGAEWVPTIWGTQLWERIRVANVIASNLQTFNMPSATFNFPLESTDPTVYFVAEGTDATQLVLTNSNTMTLSKVGSDKKQFVAKKLGARVAWSTELNEESIFPILPAYRRQMERAMMDAVDYVLVNGDTDTTANTNVNLIDGTPTTGTNYLALDGMRKYALVTNTAQAVDFGSAAPTLANFRLMRSKLARQYLIDIPNLMYVISPEVYMKCLAMPEFLTYFNVGAPGTAMTGLLPGGQLGQVGDRGLPVGFIDGIPVYVSASLVNANTAGKISATPGNNLYGSSILMHKTRAWLGIRRQATINLLSPDVSGVFSDTYQLWGTVRFDAKYFDTQSLALGYDIGV